MGNAFSSLAPGKYEGGRPLKQVVEKIKRLNPAERKQWEERDKKKTHSPTQREDAMGVPVVGKKENKGAKKTKGRGPTGWRQGTTKKWRGAVTRTKSPTTWQKGRTSSWHGGATETGRALLT